MIEEWEKYFVVGKLYQYKYSNSKYSNSLIKSGWDSILLFLNLEEFTSKIIQSGERIKRIKKVKIRFLDKNGKIKIALQYVFENPKMYWKKL